MFSMELIYARIPSSVLLTSILDPVPMRTGHENQPQDNQREYLLRLPRLRDSKVYGETPSCDFFAFADDLY